MTAAAVPWRPVPGGVEVAIRVTARATRAALGGIVGDANGDVRLAARVTPPPEDGQANAALAALLADVLGVAPSACEVVAGAGSRRKRVRVAGDVSELVRRLSASSAEAGGRARPAA